MYPSGGGIVMHPNQFQTCVLMNSSARRSTYLHLLAQFGYVNIEIEPQDRGWYPL